MTRSEINRIVKPYAKPSSGKAYWQIVNTVVPYFGLIFIMYLMISNNVNYIFVLLLSVLPALFLVRVFIFFHDCTHSSFMKSNRAMNIFGHVFGVMVFTPFHQWQREHITHHRTVGNIDKRGTGDVWTMTVEEYKNSTKLKKLGYRLYRNPILLFFIGPVYMFLINQRLPFNIKEKKEWKSWIITNLSVVSIILLVSFTVGFKYYLLIQIPIIFIASSLGVWLFFVQHQYEEVYWEKQEDWDITTASIDGCSVYRLPLILDWFSGNIGYHNIHHLNARIPNYRLRKLYNKSKEFHNSKTINIWQSFKLATLYLYDQKSKRLISRRKYKRENLSHSG